MINDSGMFEDYAKRLFDEINRITNDVCDAEDAIQMCFEWALRRSKHETVTFEKLRKVCIYAAENIVGYKNKNANLQVYATVIYYDPLDIYLHYEATESVLRCISKINVTYRRVLIMNLIQGYRACEIARLTGIKQNTVVKKIKRGKALLKSILIKKGLYK